MRSSLLRACGALYCLGVAFVLVTGARAAVTNVAWYRLGENDPGAVSGQIVNSTALDFAGVKNLRRVGSPRYTNDVSPDAAQIGSKLGVLFNGINQLYSTNAVISTAQNNFGIEAWVRTLSTANGVHVIAYNGNTAANGWGLGVVVTNHPVIGLQITYFAELNGGTRFGGGRSVGNEWVHVALVRDNGTSRFYLNGNAAGSSSSATPAIPAGSFAIAADPSSPNALFPGIIDEVRVFTFAPGQFTANDLLVNQSVVTTLPESGLALGAATLNGSASSFGFPTTVWFEWGDSTNLNNVTPPQTLGSGFSSTNFSEVLTGLAPGTYRFRAAGSNDLGVVFGSIRSFILGPTVETLAPSGVTQTAATFNGLANPNGAETVAWFEYGFTTEYGFVTSGQALGGGNSDTNFSQTVTDLIPGVVYHFRAVASNNFGVVFGGDRSFPKFAQRDYVKASNTVLSASFGGAMAMDGDTMVIGADSEFSSRGAAHVFVRSGDSWLQQALLRASNPEFSDRFGTSVAISGDTIVIGAPDEDSNATGVNGNQNDNSVTNAGAVYVFVRTGTNWTQQAYLKAADAVGKCDTRFCTGCICVNGDRFGASVAVSGDTVVVGGPFDDSNATGVNGNATDNSVTNSGAAYVFVRNGTTWTQQAYLKASNTDGFDTFGNSVAVSGNTVVVGALNESSNATGVNGAQSNNSAESAGAAYVFVRSGTTWTQQAYLKASNTAGDDLFGFGVAAAGDALVIGAPAEDSNATGINGDQTNNDGTNSGAAYVFVRNATTWSQQAYLKPSNTGVGDNFGVSLAMSGETLVIGAAGEDSNATGVDGDGSNNLVPASGAAYVFVRNGTSWSFQNYLKASNTDTNDFFGRSVAVSGEFVVVGADGEDSNARGLNGDQFNDIAFDSGAAYVFGPPLPPFAEIAVLVSTNINIVDGGSASQIVSAIGHFNTLTFTIKNTGNGPLTPLTITFDGADAAMFSVAINPRVPLEPTSNTTFTIRFSPPSSGTKTAALHIASNDEDENPFDIVLTGLSLSFAQDRDGDGLNDAAEFLMSSLGFNFQLRQTALVNTLFSNANGAGLFTQSQLQALNVDAPLLAKDPNTGLFELTIGVEKSTDLSNFFPFPMTAPQTTINAQGKLQFQFSSPDNAAFFRLESR